MSHEYSENILVQESAGNLLRDELSWDVVFAYNQEVLGCNGTLGRSSCDLADGGDIHGSKITDYLNGELIDIENDRIDYWVDDFSDFKMNTKQWDLPED